MGNKSSSSGESDHNTTHESITKVKKNKKVLDSHSIKKVPTGNEVSNLKATKMTKSILSENTNTVTCTQLIPKSNCIYQDYEVTNEVLGNGVSGKVLACIHKITRKKYALKVKLIFDLKFRTISYPSVKNISIKHKNLSL